MAYNYDPAAVAEYGKDRMRFELGDTMVEGGPDTTALTDEEIEAALSAYPKSWKRAKLMLLESLFRRFSYEVDTKTGPLTLSLQARAKLWKEMYEDLKKEVSFSSVSIEQPPECCKKPPYFYAGMMENERAADDWRHRHLLAQQGCVRPHRHAGRQGHMALHHAWAVPQHQLQRIHSPDHQTRVFWSCKSQRDHHAPEAPEGQR